MKNEMSGHFLPKTRGNGLEGGVQRIQDGYFAMFRLALDERKILVGVVDSIPQCGEAGVRIFHRSQIMEKKPKIKFRNFWIWIKDQFQRKTWFRNFFITGNAWGAFSINSHINQHTGEPKQTYNHKESALKAAESMSIKQSKKYGTDVHFSAYKCLFCDGYHVGKNRDNKTDYDNKKHIVKDVKVEDHTLKLQ